MASPDPPARTAHHPHPLPHTATSRTFYGSPPPPQLPAPALSPALPPILHHLHLHLVVDSPNLPPAIELPPKAPQMTRSEEETMSLELLAQVSEAREPEAALKGLRTIKHTMIGHDMNKERYVKLRISEPLARVLARRRGRGEQPDLWDDARVEAGIVVGSLAYGGEDYIAHLLSSNILTELVASLDPETSPPKLILSSLRTLNTMLDTYVSPNAAVSPLDAISTAVYNPEVLVYFRRILSQDRPDSVVQQQIGLAAALLAKSVCVVGGGNDTCEIAKKRQQQLVNAGILNALATRLASFYVDERKKQVKPENVDKIPRQAAPTAKLAPILQAIAAIIQGSKLHAIEFLFSPTLVALFPYKDQSDSVSKVAEGLSGATTTYMPQEKTSGSGKLQPPSQIITPAEFPPLSAAAARSPSIQFPSISSSQPFFPLAAYSSRSSGLTLNPSLEDMDTERGGRDDDRPEDEEEDDPSEIEESELIVRLISQVRSGDAMTRLAAASVLTNLFIVGLVNKKLHSLVSLLVVPVLVRLLDGDDQPRKTIGLGTAGVGGVDMHTWNRWQVQEAAPTILARLVVDDQKLRKAAVESGAIQNLAAILSATCESESSSEDGDGAAENPLNKGGPHYNHRQRVKDGVLRALANLALEEEPHKKMVIDAKVVKLVKNNCLKSLAPLPQLPASAAAKMDDKSEPNTPAVLISACSLIRSISRSIYILRTELIDAEIGVPVYNLVFHPSIDVRNAAVAVLINLVLEFSPMRPEIIEAGAIPKLCQLAKGDNHALQRDALWALKHVVQKATFSEKEQVLNGLGSEYLLSIISHIPPTTDDFSSTQARSHDDEDEVMSDDLGDFDDAGSDTPRASARSSAVPSITHSPTAATTPVTASPSTPFFPPLSLPPRAASLMAEIRRQDRHTQRTRHQRHLISLQHLAFGFLSNLLFQSTDKKSSTTSSQESAPQNPHIIDHLLPYLSGAANLFSILTQILTSASSSISSTSSSSSSSSTQPPATSSASSASSSSSSPPPEIIESCITFISNFTACGTSHHRNLVINNTPLMDSIKALERYERQDVRAQMCWLVINLTSVDEEERGDAVVAEEIRARVARLREMGWVEMLRRLSHDSARDVQERVKTAVAQIEMVEKERRTRGL